MGAEAQQVPAVSSALLHVLSQMHLAALHFQATPLPQDCFVTILIQLVNLRTNCLTQAYFVIISFHFVVTKNYSIGLPKMNVQLTSFSW